MSVTQDGANNSGGFGDIAHTYSWGGSAAAAYVLASSTPKPLSDSLMSTLARDPKVGDARLGQTVEFGHPQGKSGGALVASLAQERGVVPYLAPRLLEEALGAGPVEGRQGSVEPRAVTGLFHLGQLQVLRLHTVDQHLVHHRVVGGPLGHQCGVVKLVVGDDGDE